MLYEHQKKIIEIVKFLNKEHGDHYRYEVGEWICIFVKKKDETSSTSTKNNRSKSK